MSISLMKKREIMRELKEEIEQSNANQKRQILQMIELIYEYRGDFDRDKKLEEALENFLEE